MRKDITYCLLLSLLVFFNPIASALPNYDELIDDSYKKRRAGFANLEHRALGNSVTLKWGGLPHQLPNNHLELSNGMVVSYGEIIMFAGDLFGSKDHPISSCSPQKRPLCFYKQFDSIDQIRSKPYQNAPTQIPIFRQYLAELDANIKQAKNNGIPEWKYYFENGSNISKKLNRLSGGGSLLSDYIPFGEYIKLANVNYDHFIPGALVAYKTGHKIALETAIQARQANLSGQSQQAYKLLSMAYAMNGYSNHFLTDSMSAGHFRTPRRKIAEHVFLPKALCLLIANLMHDEDNRVGLNVTNKRGLSWHAFGDGFLGLPEANQHYTLIKQLVQESADAVYAAYETGKMPTDYPELSLLPDYQNINQLNNHPPLFKWENNHLYKRKSNFDIYNDQYTVWWSGVITLVEFNKHDWSKVFVD